MKTLFFDYLKLSAILMLSTSFSLNLNARVGETKNDIQDRMLTKTSGAYLYTAKEERLREAMELPYKYIFLLMPDDVIQCFFFKRPDVAQSTMGDTIQQHELYGWEMNFSLKGDKSVLEFYRRHGDPITKEEITALFNLQKKENSHWKKSDFISTNKKWNIAIKDGKLVYENKTSNNVADILPEIKSRFIYIEIPEDVKKSTDFSQSIQYQIVEYEQRNAYAKYRKYLDKKSEQKAAKTKRTKKSNTPTTNASTRKINPASGYSHKYLESEFTSNDNSKVMRLGYSLEDVFLKESPLTSPTKEVRLTVKIPQQPDTAFGYSYETSDGLVRAKLYKDSVFFIDAKFDKELRSYMEELYKKQTEKRNEDAQESVSKF